jgi:hypothetical protein
MSLSPLKTAALATVAALAFSTSGFGLTILTTDSDSYLGSVQPGVPSGDTQVEGYVDQLAGMAPGASISIDGNLFIRSDNTFGMLPDADFAWKQDDNTTTFDLTGGSFDYVLAKYGVGQDGGTLVWYIAGLLDIIQLPASAFSGTGLSHTTFFNASASVPDGGLTATLLGLGLVGLAYFSRRRTA